MAQPRSFPLRSQFAQRKFSTSIRSSTEESTRQKKIVRPSGEAVRGPTNTFPRLRATVVARRGAKSKNRRRVSPEGASVKLHWLAEQALNWSGLPVVHVRPTVLLEGFFL